MRTVLFLLVLATATPACAAATPWQDLVPGARARLITADKLEADGSMLAGIEIDMPANYRTYWKTPGETGIPTVLDFSGSGGISGETVLWPYPSVENSQGYLDYVYNGPVVLPVTVKLAGTSATLDVAATLGICSDICMPASAKFSLPVEAGEGDAGQGLRLRQALAETPLPWTKGPEPIGNVAIDAGGRALAVRLDGPDIDPDTLIAATGDPADLFGTPQKSREPGIILLPWLGTSDIKGLEGRPVQITFMAGAIPYEISRRVSAAVSSK